MPQNDAISASQNQDADERLARGEPAAETVSSLKNNPNGGRPIAATAASPMNSTVTGSTFTTPGPMTRNFEGVKRLVDVARREEQHRLGQRMIAHVQQRAENGHRRVQADAGADEADVFEAGIGEHPLEVALHENERRGQEHGEQAEAQQQVRLNPVPRHCVVRM